MNSPTERSLLEAWRHGWPFPGTIYPYLVLGGLTISATSPQWGSVSVNLTLCALAAVWLLIPLHPALRRRVPVMAVFIAGLIAVTAILIVRDPWFGFFVVAGYGYSIRFLPWPRSLPCVGALAVLAGTAQTWSVNKGTPAGLAAFFGVSAINVLSVCGIVWFLHGIEKAHDQRKHALDELSEANRRLEATLAENAGLHEQLLTQAREAGVLDERQRMAREIHDTLAQGLAGIITQLQAAEQAGEGPAGWRRHVQAATRLARESLSDARRSVDALRPEPLEAARLSDALAAVAERWSVLHGIAVQVTTTGTVRPMRPDAELALLRTAQEALANVAKHAHATRVVLTLSFMEDEVALDVRDDGAGFDPARLADGARGGSQQAFTGPYAAPLASGRARPRVAGGGGFGLVAMRQRIEGLAGTLQVESEPGAGTEISACVPAALTDVSG
jgi:signal transduction histidine kinase